MKKYILRRKRMAFMELTGNAKTVANKTLAIKKEMAGNGA